MKIVTLVGGVGGAKLALGLSRVLPAEDLTIVVNTGDDTWMYGLRICPDMDTIMYTLAGLVDPVNGWGIAGDTTHALEALRRYGEDAWFRLGDQDMATHIIRTRYLRAGRSLTDVTALLTKKLGIPQTILPMTDSPVATMVDTVEYGEIDFQTYFVRHRWQPQVKGLRLDGIEVASVPEAVTRALNAADAVLIAPSNPWLSIDPILAVPGLRDQLMARPIPRVAISPIVGGAAIKGPAAKMMVELGHEASASAVFAHYGDLLNGYVYDVTDHSLSLSAPHTAQFKTVMKTDDDKEHLARVVIEWIQTWMSM